MHLQRSLFFLVLILAGTSLLSSCTQEIVFLASQRDNFFEQVFSYNSSIKPQNDVLVIIDDSLSMKDEMEKLKAALVDLTETLSQRQVSHDIYVIRVSDIRREALDQRNIVFSREKLVKFESNDAAAIIEYFNNSAPQPIDTEPGLALSAKAAERIISEFTDAASLLNLNIVMLSDENSTNKIKSRYSPEEKDIPILEPTRHTYQFRRSRHFAIRYYTKNLCTLDGNPHNANFGNYNHQHYCVEKGHPDAIGKFETFHPRDLGPSYEVCNRPDYYFCDEIKDGQTIPNVRVRHNKAWNPTKYINCTPDDTTVIRGLIHKSISAATRIQRSYRACAPLNCERNFFTRDYISLDSSNNTAKFEFHDSCGDGFSPHTHTSSVYVRAVLENIYSFNQPGLPPGVTKLGPYPYHWSYEEHDSHEFLTEDELRKKIAEMHPEIDYLAHPNLIVVDHIPEEKPLERSPLLLSTPKDFGELMKRHQNVQTFFHSIVALDDNPCSNSKPPNEEGKDYLALTQLLGGVSSNICDPNFSEFADKLAENVEESDLETYPLGQIITDKHSTSLRNVQTGTDYQLGIDYFIVNGAFLQIRKDLLQSGQSIHFTATLPK